MKQLRNAVNKVQKKQQIVAVDEDKYIFGVSPPEPRVPRSIFSPDLKLVDLEEVEIARQMTLMEFAFFCGLKVHQLVFAKFYFTATGIS